MKIVWQLGAAILLAGLLACLVILLVYHGIIAKYKHDLTSNTSAFLNALQSQDYEKAANLYGNSLDIDKIRKLDENQGFRLLSFDNISSNYDDGCVCTGKAELTFEVKGAPLNVTAIVTTGTDYKPGQICAITPSGVKRGSIPELSEWNIAACGSDSF
ncbi:hypothetical protein [Paenibacillus sp. UNC451MF]|uniref:hypothetical protein n=1 Tax=Paenibacillus sp. UNC451MF TaxID=1449063 RepID=UPI00048F56BB|nr:hypothetical protein [Paenibacillus sp. UNC451MF]